MEVRRAREKAVQKREMEKVIRMIFFDVLLVALLIFICLGNRDPNAFPYRKSMEHVLRLDKSEKVRMIHCIKKHLVAINQCTTTTQNLS